MALCRFGQFDQKCPVRCHYDEPDGSAHENGNASENSNLIPTVFLTKLK